jgi:hypothetical protein
MLDPGCLQSQLSDLLAETSRTLRPSSRPLYFLFRSLCGGKRAAAFRSRATAGGALRAVACGLRQDVTKACQCRRPLHLLQSPLLPHHFRHFPLVATQGQAMCARFATSCLLRRTQRKIVVHSGRRRLSLHVEVSLFSYGPSAFGWHGLTVCGEAMPAHVGVAPSSGRPNISVEHVPRLDGSSGL